MSVKVFICAPYGDHNPIEMREENVRQAMNVWHWLRSNGFVPICPHLSHYLHEHEPRERADWLLYARQLLEMCDCVVVPDNEIMTEGMKQEILDARIAGKPVFISVELLLEAYGL